jgi:hypothetical protein
VSGGAATWLLGDFGPKAVKEIRITGVALAEGFITGCATASFRPVAVCETEAICRFPLGGVESAAKRSFSGFARARGTRAEKIGRGGFMPQRSGGYSRLKRQAGQRPSKGGKCHAVGVIPLRFRSSVSSEAGEKRT